VATLNEKWGSKPRPMPRIVAGTDLMTAMRRSIESAKEDAPEAAMRQTPPAAAAAATKPGCCLLRRRAAANRQEYLTLATIALRRSLAFWRRSVSATVTLGVTPDRFKVNCVIEFFQLSY
jgi:hypothetical protein